MGPLLEPTLKEKFDEQGYLVIENFLTQEEVQEMKNEMQDILDRMNPLEHPKAVFTTSKSNQIRDSYFLESVDKIRFFYEEDAFNEKEEMIVKKQEAFNKVGHGYEVYNYGAQWKRIKQLLPIIALHWLNPVFKNATFSSRVQRLVEILGFQDPIVPQSMYIFKDMYFTCAFIPDRPTQLLEPGLRNQQQRKIGGVVKGHMDASYLIADPPDRVVGLWFALDDATTDNGCLWFVPGSHKGTPVLQKLLRTHAPEEPPLKYVGEDEMRPDSAFVAAPIKKGGCVVIHGLVWHKSEANRSGKPRHAYTFHVFDQGSAEWSPEGWLQPTPNYSFPRLRQN